MITRKGQYRSVELNKKTVKNTLGNHRHILNYLERHEVICLNPYVLIVENNVTMTIYPTLNPDGTYQVKLP